jgi:hypothetical protein
MPPQAQEKQRMPNYISLKVGDELYGLLAGQADARGVPLNEACAQILAEGLGRPELGYVPRKTQMGRPRTKVVAAQ